MLKAARTARTACNVAAAAAREGVSSSRSSPSSLAPWRGRRWSTSSSAVVASSSFSVDAPRATTLASSSSSAAPFHPRPAAARLFHRSAAAAGPSLSHGAPPRRTPSNTSCRSLSTTSLPDHIVVGMPALSPTMESGTIVSWKVNEGEAFEAGTVLAEIETDKATIDFEAQDDGIVAKILVEPGNEIAVGKTVMITVHEPEDVAAFAGYVAEETAADAASAPAGGADAAASAGAASDAAAAAQPPQGRVPSIRFLGKDGWAARRLGAGGITKASSSDATTAQAATAVAAAAAPPAAAAKTAPTKVEVNIPPISTVGQTYTDVPNNNMRKVIARRLTESKSSVPHFYTSIEVELDSVLALRKSWASSKEEIKVSVNDFVIKAVAMALRDVPEVNGSFDAQTNTLRAQDDVDVSVAVATPTGLITPIVPSAHTLGLVGVSAKIRDLATRARDNKLKPEEYQGGTFCVSNLGMFGINEFSAVINPPQAAILAVGGGTKQVVPTPYVEEEGSEQKNKPGIRTVMTARLSADRRVVDEPTAGLFLAAFRRYLTQPELLVL